MPDTVGVRIVPIEITNPKIIMINDYLPLFLTIPLITNSPTIVPIIAKVDNHNAKYQFSLLEMMY